MLLVTIIIFTDMTTVPFKLIIENTELAILISFLGILKRFISSIKILNEQSIEQNEGFI